MYFYFKPCVFILCILVVLKCVFEILKNVCKNVQIKMVTIKLFKKKKKKYVLIISKVLATRMSTVLGDVIHPDQACAVPG